MPNLVKKFKKIIKGVDEATVTAHRIVVLSGSQVSKQTTRQKKAVAVALGKRTRSKRQKARVANQSSKVRTGKRS